MSTSVGIMSNYLEDVIIQHMLIGNEYTMPETVYLGVHGIGGAEEGDTGTEITGGYYEHSRISSVLAEEWTVNENIISNTVPFTFGTATSPWGYVYGWGIYDQLIAGNLMLWGLFDSEVYISVNESLRIPAGKLPINFSCTSGVGGWTSFSSNKMAEWVVNGTPFDLTITGTKLALVYDITTDTNNNLIGYKEISDADYTRKPLPASTSWELSAVKGSAWNKNDIIFVTEALEDWNNTITGVILFDNDTELNPIFWGYLNSPLTIKKGDGFKINEGGLMVNFY